MFKGTIAAIRRSAFTRPMLAVLGISLVATLYLRGAWSSAAELAGIGRWVGLVAAGLLVLLGIRKAPKDAWGYTELARTVLVALAAIMIVQVQFLTRARIVNYGNLKRILELPASSQWKPSIIVYRMSDQGDTRNLQRGLEDVFTSAGWNVQAPLETLTNPPPLSGIGWMRFRGPRPREQAGRSHEEQVVLTEARERWQTQLRAALETIGDECGIDDQSAGSTVDDTSLGYIYIGPISDSYPTKTECRAVPGRLRGPE